MLPDKEVATPFASVANDPVFISIEMSRSKWVVGAHVPTADRVSIRVIDWGDITALLALIERLRARAAAALGFDAPILCCYEAGYEGFWVYRLLTAAGHRVLVIDPASLLVNRRAQRAKTDRIDAKTMIRALMAFNRGEHQVLSAVHVPTVRQDDERRLMRERQRLVQERTAHTNRIKGLLLTQGITGFDPRARGAVDRLDHLTTGDGRTLGPRLADEIRRELARLQLVIDQLAVVEAQRDRIALAQQANESMNGSDETMIAALARIRGVGSNDASVLIREAFWRKFRNRREIAAWSGFARTAWASGAVSRDQGITKSGPAAFRAHMIQLTWRWLQWQPGSRLSRWFNERTNGATGRVRRIMVVALARKLLIALWRYATTGLVPTGAVVT